MTAKDVADIRYLTAQGLALVTEQGFPLTHDAVLAERISPKTGERLTADAAASGPPVARPRATPLQWSTFMTTDFGDVDWLPGQLMVRGQQIALVGDGKAGKSLLTQEWSWRMAAGLPFLGDDCGRPPLRVLYVDQENPQEEIQARLRSFGAKPDTLENLVYLSFPPFRALDTVEGAVDVVAAVEEHRADVVVFDTISRMIRGKENDSDTWLAVYRCTMLPLKARKVSSIRLDHFGKDADRGARGSSAKTQDIDHVWELTAQTDKALRLRRTHTRTGIGTDDLALQRNAKLNGDRWEEGGTSHTLAAANGVPTQWAGEGVKQIAQRLDDAGVPRNLGRDRVREACTRLGIKVRNEVLADVIAYRKTLPAQPSKDDGQSRNLSGTGQVLQFPNSVPDSEGDS